MPTIIQVEEKQATGCSYEDARQSFIAQHGLDPHFVTNGRKVIQIPKNDKQALATLLEREPYRFKAPRVSTQISDYENIDEGLRFD